jgi:hypothetical protein
LEAREVTRREKTVAEKIGEWHLAYQAVLEEIQRPMLVAAKDRDLDYGSAHVVIDVLAVNSRTAAIVAAMLVGQGVRLPTDGPGREEWP